MEIQKRVALKEFTTFKIGGDARFFCRISSAEELVEALIFAKKERVPYFVLGGGSNLLVSDDGFAGLVIKMEVDGVVWNEDKKNVLVSAGAGVSWDGLVAESVDRGLYGLENLSGIPGTVGAAPVQNIGAYGSEVKDAIEYVEVFDPAVFKARTLTNAECEFSYRSSFFKTQAGKKFIIMKVGLRLPKNGKPKLEYRDLADYFAKAAVKPRPDEIRAAILAIRGRKFPDLARYGTAGSFFKNPILSKKMYESVKAKFPGLPSYPARYGRVKVPLGWILEHVLDLKGAKRNDVGCWSEQALVLTNYGSAGSNDVAKFAEDIARDVKVATGIEIEWEVRFVG